ncbi:DNA (cytosine-5-)-methyltransferase [Rhizobium sp. 32-5/1]|uniref:DNA cytosine methyltransferase n=1 Tax=Rhizobium sp. 32-5/1 TaxID=3019602 RepID=UPI00240D3873|nr:DNA (cytosine-5-)-methyltransferase [Rhizobium sp. 32-5/1]WEZ83425.1 DNA (cytosine-5-)-methyltransferase [Rhizobium sp. 32-5/1]
MLQESADVVEVRAEDENCVSENQIDHFKVARASILRARKRITDAMLAIVSATEDLRENTGIDAKRTHIWLMEDCGLSKADARTVRFYPDRLRKDEQVIRLGRVAPEAIRALVATTDEVRAEAVTRISSGEVMSPYKVQAIRRAQLALTTPDSHDWYNEGQLYLRKRASQQSAHLLYDIRNAARALLDERRAAAVRHAAIADMDQVEFDYFYVETPEWARDVETLVDLSRALREKFEILFPGPHPTGAEALTLGVDDPYAAWIANTYHGLYDLMSDCRPCRTDGEELLRQLAGLKPAPEPSIKSASQSEFEAAAVGLDLPGRLRMRPVKTLKSVELCAGIGGEAIGLSAAGFRPSILVDNDMHATLTLMANRPDWTVRRKRLDHPIVTGELSKLRDQIDLVAGGVPCQPFSTGGNSEGVADKRNQFPQAIEIVKAVRPKAFYFENVEGLLDSKHTPHLLDIISRLQEHGYNVGTYVLDAADWGVAQRRRRMIIYGLSSDLGVKELTVPMPSRDLRTNFRNSVTDILFPYWSASRAHQDASFPIADQREYDEWVEAWLGVHGDKVAPTVTGVNPNKAVTGRWESVGIDYSRLLPEPVRPGELPPNGLAPVTISLLMRLQGFPTGWQLSPNASLLVKRTLVANAFPPVLARVVGQQLHGVISGEHVDLTAAASAPINLEALKPAVRKGLNRTRYPDDPRREAASQTRYKLEAEIVPDYLFEYGD